LRHISGFSQLLLDNLGAGADPQVRHYLSRIMTRTHEAGALIDDLLAFSRTGRATLGKVPVAAATLVRDLAESLGAEHPHRTFEWRIGDLPTVTADPALLRVVFTNLLENAVKYSREQPVSVIEVSSRRQASGWVFAVGDNGVGFDMQFSDKLFGVFQRLHSEEEFEGTGIGLATVRRIVARHGGHTGADGTPGAGATFWFSLPDHPAVDDGIGAL
jgi:light-regulated signal transduction histidine kinase (bacteriophytochrome)